MAQFIKSQSPEELWKASLKNPLKPDDPSNAVKPTPTLKAAVAPGTGIALDVTA